MTPIMPCFYASFFLIFSYSKKANIIGEGKGLKLVDAPVSGGVKRASEGTLTV